MLSSPLGAGPTIAPLPATDAAALWTSLDPEGSARVAWARPPSSRRVVVLLGAFDPPTNAHLEVVRAAARAVDAAPVLGMTKVLLARPPDELLPRERRVDVLLAVAKRIDAGLVFANRGTYLDVARVLRADDLQATFVVGADKIVQLADPSFYSDGPAGVRATFEELRFVVVGRGGVDRTALPPGSDVRFLDPSDVFTDDATAEISGTEVRRLHRSGERVASLVPPEVALALRGYTSAR